MSVKLLIEQILMDEQINNEGTIGIDDVIRELKHGVHEITYQKTVKERISRGNYKTYDVVNTYEVTNDPAIFNELIEQDPEEDAEQGMSARKDPKVRAGMNAVHRLVTVFDINAKTFKTLKYANILKFDGIEVNHDDASNPITAAHKKTGDEMYDNYTQKAKEIPGYKDPSRSTARHLTGIATDTSINPERIGKRDRYDWETDAMYNAEKRKMNKIRGMQHMFRNRANKFEDDNNERIY